MRATRVSFEKTLCRTPMALALAAALTITGLAAATGAPSPLRAAAADAPSPPRAAFASTPNGLPPVYVENCDDSGPGSLRAVVDQATNGEIVDLSELTCSTISLTTGAIAIGVDSLMIGDGYLVAVAPGRSTIAPHAPPTPRITIDGGGSDRVFDHAGSGQLTIYHLAVLDGFVLGDGGCIRSAGDVFLFNSVVSGCQATDTDHSHGKGGGLAATNIETLGSEISDNRASGYQPHGGGAFASGQLRLEQTVLRANQAEGYSPIGGGAFVGDYLRMYGATVSGNLSLGTDSGQGLAGGLYVRNRAEIANSTIAGNRSDDIGGLFAVGFDGTRSTLSESTVSGNQGGRTGGVFALESGFDVYNSTIAFNTATGGSGGAGGIALGAASTFVSAIVADNLAGTLPSDIGRTNGAPTDLAIAGDHDLIVASVPTAPPDTLMADPMLAPLADHGGATPTHALLSGSPAIDFGSNPKGDSNDQRGNGYTRTVGTSTDIGAYEYGAVYEFIFHDGFDE